MRIDWRNGRDIDEEQRKSAEDRLEALAEQGNDLMNVMITSKSTKHHRHGGHEIHIVCRARGRELVATRCRPDAGRALFDALGALEREVRDLRSRRTDHRGRTARGAPRVPEPETDAEQADAGSEPLAAKEVE